MSEYKKPSHGKKSSPHSGPAKVGGQSSAHRGYRSSEATSGAPKKARWNADERAARASGRSGERPNWEPRENRPTGKGARPAYGDRPNHGGARPTRGASSERSSYGDRTGRNNDRAPSGDRQARTERPAYGDRNQRNERPDYNSRPNRDSNRPSNPDQAHRAERPAYGDRNHRTERTERTDYNSRPNRDSNRPSYPDQAHRAERPAYGDRNQRNERPSYGDRPQRSERPAYGDRPNRTDDRSSYGDRSNRGGERTGRGERPRYSADRPQRTERPAYGDRNQRSERPSYGDRPAYSDRPSHDDRPRRDDRASYSDRGAAPERPARRRDFDTRPPKRDFDRPGFHTSERSASKFYPSKEKQAHHESNQRGHGHAPIEDVVLGRLTAEAITAAEVEGVTFADLGLGGNIVRQLAELGAEKPFPIQAATIPDVLAGKNVLGRGKTGSGKTIAFGAPLVERLMENDGGKNRKPGRKPRALILAPTRELALQIDRTVQPIARSVGLFTTQIYGGVPQYRQVGALQRGVDIVIGTPGRMEDLIEQGRLDLSEVTITVLDEADHMCDLGFLEPVQRILKETADDGQRLLFSATLDKGVAQLVNEFLPEPAVHEVAGEDQASSTIDHKVFLIEHRDKARIIAQLAHGAGKTLIFSRTRSFAEQLADQLEDQGIPATSLHGDLNQSRRTRNLSLLTSGRVNVLVATDVAARGIHVDDISLVIQADAPDEYKSYLHRAGRTGRAGKQGTVVTLIPRSRRRRMEELLDRAEITASFREVAPGDTVLDELAAL